MRFVHVTIIRAPPNRNPVSAPVPLQQLHSAMHICYLQPSVLCPLSYGYLIFRILTFVSGKQGRLGPINKQSIWNGLIISVCNHFTQHSCILRSPVLEIILLVVVYLCSSINCSVQLISLPFELQIMDRGLRTVGHII